MTYRFTLKNGSTVLHLAFPDTAAHVARSLGAVSWVRVW
jgi:hypothetical protein